MDKKTGLIAVSVLLFSSVAHAQAWKGLPFSVSTGAFSGGMNSDWSTGSLVPAPISVSTGTASKISPFGNKTLKDLVEGVEPAEPGSNITTIAVYKGDGDIKKSYNLNIPKDAHWRVLWKIEPSKEKSLVKLEIRSSLDKSYLQGITKELIPEEGGAFGVINVCLTTGGDITLSLDVSHAGWMVEIQQF